MQAAHDIGEPAATLPQPDMPQTFRPEFHAILYAAEKTHFWFKARNRLITWIAKRFYPSPEAILEMGCGNACVLEALSKQFPKTRAVGLELFAEGVRNAQERLPAAEIIQSPIEQAPLPAGSFDIVGAFDVVEHIIDAVGALRQCHRMARPGGILLLTVPQHKFMWTRSDELACHQRRYERAELIAQVEEAGWQTRYTTSFISLLMPLMMLARINQKKLALLDDETYLLREMQISPFINQCLDLACRAEYSLIRLGVRFPFGGSLLLVAQKPA